MGRIPGHCARRWFLPGAHWKLGSFQWALGVPHADLLWQTHNEAFQQLNKREKRQRRNPAHQTCGKSATGMVHQARARNGNNIHIPTSQIWPQLRRTGRAKPPNEEFEILYTYVNQLPASLRRAGPSRMTLCQSCDWAPGLLVARAWFAGMGRSPFHANHNMQQTNNNSPLLTSNIPQNDTHINHGTSHKGQTHRICKRCEACRVRRVAGSRGCRTSQKHQNFDFITKAKYLIIFIRYRNIL